MCKLLIGEALPQGATVHANTDCLVCSCISVSEVEVSAIAVIVTLMKPSMRCQPYKHVNMKRVFSVTDFSCVGAMVLCQSCNTVRTCASTSATPSEVWHHFCSAVQV